jgi:environmental stress-induced protein Ves
VRLGINGQWFDLDRHSAPFAFDGAVPVDCQLLGGPTRDFNLMVRQPLGPALMRRVAGHWSITLEKSKLIAIYSITTGAEARFGSKTTALPAGCLAWQWVPAGVEIGLSAAEALWMEVSL